jgi:hypothetical protein
VNSARVTLNPLAESFPTAAHLASLACIAAFTGACSGPSLATASSEPHCPQCSVVAESDSTLLELHSHDDALFVLDERGAISTMPKAGGALSGLVAAGSSAAHFGATATALAWVGLDDPSDTKTSRVHALARDGSDGPPLPAFQGAPELAVGLGDAFVGAFSGDATGSQVVRYSLSSGASSSPAETLSDEEQTELPIVAGGDAEVVWCRTHADQSSSLWRLGASGDPTKTDYPFSCAGLWTVGDGQVFVLDQASGMNCYYRIDATDISQVLTCTSGEDDHFVPLADGSVAFVDGSVAVRRVTVDGQVSTLFSAENLVGIQSEGDQFYYATFVHIGSVAWRAPP